MSTQQMITFIVGLAIGGAAIAISAPHLAIAEGTNGALGLYQIQSGSPTPPGVSSIWRVNTATGALDLCTYASVTPAGSSHISCQGNTSPQK
jgi:hypothetical protein